ncbi:hypothetical protein SGA01_15580 [Streptomyces gardneri]|uniref:Uncharacterized protein n=1 Tax=Streptomyces gardneri TaxID=66892 RepID=A0A4Y3RH05_9ACTN|nr:hypothetical protein SGA01_15580 [Streptomyces gardneri]
MRAAEVPPALRATVWRGAEHRPLPQASTETTAVESGAPAASVAGPAGGWAAVPTRTAPTARGNAPHPRTYLRDGT